jgi:hypothetical protein
VLLIRSYRKIEDRNERRRLRVVAAGFGIGVFAMALVVILTMPLGPIQRFRYGYLGEIYFNAEAYNLFNNANFGPPNNDLSVRESFGRISTTVGNARVLQMALRYDF